jgi:hypothetical protein
MSCSCIADIEAQSPEHKLEVAIFITKPHGMEARPFIGLLRRDTGKRENRTRRPTCAAPTYCPFCGTAYAARAA